MTALHHPVWSRSRAWSRRLALFALSLSCASCWPWFGETTPLENASALVPAKCSHINPEYIALVVAKQSIESVKADYAWAIVRNNHEMRLRGAVLQVRAFPGATPELIARTLECHEARVVLGEPTVADDPYVLPGRWVQIEASSDGDALLVTLRADDFDDRKAILGRARHYVGLKPLPD